MLSNSSLIASSLVGNLRESWPRRLSFWSGTADSVCFTHFFRCRIKVVLVWTALRGLSVVGAIPSCLCLGYFFMIKDRISLFY